MLMIVKMVMKTIGSIGEDGKPVEVENPNFTIIGNSTLESLQEFKDGKRKIIDGKMYKEKNECIVSEELAKLNNIKVGDFIEINRVGNKDGKPYKLKVSGIYFDSIDEYGGMPFKASVYE